MTRAAGLKTMALERHLPGIEEILSGGAAAIGRAITLLERGAPGSMELLDTLRAKIGQAFRVGFTGPPGAGKSSLLREVIRRLRSSGERAALVASDPVSPITGGALLGDRCRLSALSQDPGVFVRSVAHRPGADGPGTGLSKAALRAADVLDASGFPWIFLETVGTGQADTEALRCVDWKVLVHSPESGDHIQMLKAGLAETVDIHVVTKLDRPGALAWAQELAETLSAGAEKASRRAEVFPLSSTTGEGVDELVEALKSSRRARSLQKEREKQ
jgi:LAO/AO transport system kinase